MQWEPDENCAFNLPFQKMGSNRIAPLQPATKNMASVAIEMERTHLSTDTLHSHLTWTGEQSRDNKESIIDALSKSSGWVS